MKKYLPVMYLVLFAIFASYILGYGLKKNGYYMSTFLVFFGFIYLFFGFMYRNLKVKHLRREQENPYGELDIADRHAFFRSVRILYLAGITTFIVYFIFLYVFGIGMSVLE